MNRTISASCHTDDYRYEIQLFDATPWFIVASDADIQQLIEDGFSGNYTADSIAEDAGDYDAQVRAMFAYLDSLPASYEPRGFECYVDEAQALAWIQYHRPHLLEQWGLDEKGVSAHYAREVGF